jgi:phenylalanyl-tRNA synthetase beta chain
MKFSENWLRELVNPSISREELVAQLTMAGLEVDGVEPVAAVFNKVVIGEIISIDPHPDAKKLQICTVNIGDEEPLTIVCGAANVHVGMRAPTALIGARIGKIKIKKSKLRGVLSYGMLCSAEELGLADSSEGLMSLANDAPLGEDLREYLKLDDVSFDVDLTPNRGDCLSVAGIAREVGVLTRTAVNYPKISNITASITDSFLVDIQADKACPRYVGRIIKNIDAKAATPLWMQERLRRSGLRSISAVVDITNYVLLELGQPMHAFDFNSLSGGIQVRMATAGESLTLLDEQTVKLDEQTLVIADHKQALAIAGVMGGQASAVTDSTTDIFLESAFFAPEYAAGCARRYGLHTDSSHRFERGVDSQLQVDAIERATELLLEIVGGEAGVVIEKVADTLPVASNIELRAHHIKRILGKSFEAKDITDIFTRLGMKIEGDDSSWQIQAPSFRFDVSIEADLIEELARLYGYNNLPSQAPKSRLIMHSSSNRTVNQLKDVLVQRDYQEAITYSFVDSKLQTQLNPELKAINLANPIASDMAAMRTSLWSSLLPAVQYNQKRQQSRVRLFETGRRFIQSQTEGLLQELMIAGVVTGTRFAEQWGAVSQAVDFYDVKSDIEALLNADDIDFRADTHPALHPGKTAAIYRGDEYIGIIGAAHPSLIKQLDLITPVFLFELKLAPLLQNKPHKFQELSKYPNIRRDIAVIVPQDVTAIQLMDCIKETAPEILIEWQLFDVYQGDKIDSNKKSLAIGLIFQAFSRNLIDQDVETVVEQLLNTLETKLGAKLRN